MKSKILSLLACALMVSTIATAQEKEQDTKKGKITFDKTVHDFGTIEENIGKATYKFEFTNTGNAPVLLSNVIASCGCTTPDWTKEPILPGKKGSVTVSYSTIGRVAPFVKSLTVMSNGDPASIALQIKGEVIKSKEEAAK